MKNIKSLLIGLAVGVGAIAHAGQLIVTVSSVTTTTSSTGGAIASASWYVNGDANVAMCAANGVSVFSQTAGASQVTHYQLYWQQTSTGESPPSTIYLHQALSGQASASVSGESNSIHAGGAAGDGSLGSCSIGYPEPGNPILSQSRFVFGTSTTSYNVSSHWVYYGTQSGLNIYKLDEILNVQGPTVSATAAVSGGSGVAMGTGVAGLGIHWALS